MSIHLAHPAASPPAGAPSFKPLQPIAEDDAAELLEMLCQELCARRDLELIFDGSLSDAALPG